MSLHKIFSYAVAVAALVAATAICLVAAAFAIYALAAMQVGPAGAAAIVSGIFALVAIVMAVAMSRKAKGKPALTPAPEETLFTRALALAKERPLVAAGVGAAAVAMIIRNPAIVSTLISAVIAGKAAKPDR
ncbi:MAG: hypothetical protein JWO33_2325 [Caulobacteraceae bacterium]|nr:hypothetical protein [Caulobacteraceae bacterium]